MAPVLSLPTHRRRGLSCSHSSREATTFYTLELLESAEPA